MDQNEEATTRLEASRGGAENGVEAEQGVAASPADIAQKPASEA